MQDPADVMDEPLADDDGKGTAGIGVHTVGAAIVDAPHADEDNELSDTMPRRAITHEDLASDGAGSETSAPPTDSPPDATRAIAGAGDREVDREVDRVEEMRVEEDSLRGDDPDLTLPRRPLPVEMSTELATAPDQSMSAELPDAFPDFIPPYTPPPYTPPPGGLMSLATKPMEEQALTSMTDEESAPATIRSVSEPAPVAPDGETAPLPANTEMAGDPTLAALAEEPVLISKEDEPALAAVVAEPEPEPPSMTTEPEPAVALHAFQQSQPYSAALVQAELDLLESYTAPATEPALTASVPPSATAPSEIPPPLPLSTPYSASQPVRETRAAEPTVPFYENLPSPPLPPVVDVSGIHSQVPPEYWIHENPLEDTRLHMGLTGSRPVVREAGRPLPQPRRFRRPARWRSFLVLVVVSVLIAFACGAALSIGVAMLTRPPAAPTPIPTHTIAPTASPSPRK